MSYDDSYEDEDEEYGGGGEVGGDSFDEKNGEDEEVDPNKYNHQTIEMEIHEAIRKRKEEKRSQQHQGDKAYLDQVDEHLDENFEETQWVPPSIEVAWEYHLSHLYRGGKIPLSRVKLTKSTDIGLGIPMYFLYTKILGITLFLMACLSLPAITFSFFGHRISSENQDLLHLYRFTIGNIGFDSASTNYDELTLCTGSSSLQCIHLFTQEFSLQSVANILSICEILQILVFFIGIFFLKSACGRVRGGIGNRTCCVSDYAIRVDNIPSNTTVNELLQHFSNLYQLETVDWKNRKPLEGATPVSNVYHNGQALYKGKWIADVVIFSKIGKLIRSFKEKKKNMEELLRYRAMMKMYKEDTCHADGPNPRRYQKAEENMLYAGTKIDEQTKSALASAKLDAEAANEPHPTSQIKGLKSDAVVAFITFNYSESMARCVDDYRFYNTFPFSLFMPSQLKFRGHKIKVTHAPEPDEIVWENLEISNTSKISRRIFSGLVAFLLMLIGFACILQSAKYRRIFDANVPQLSMCDSEIPALYAGTYDIPSTVEIVRPDVDPKKDEVAREVYDQECQEYIDNSFYAIYTEDGNFKHPLANYSIQNVCKYSGSTATNECPSYGQTSFCPCIVTKSSTDCPTLQCSLGSGTCEQFKYTTVAGCYCYQQLTNLLTGSVFQMIYNIQHVDVECEEFLTGYLIAISLLLIASLVTVVLNFFLRVAMTFLSRREFHETNAEEQRAIVVKIFGTTYINMACVVLLAYGYVRNEPQILVQASILHGEYSDFSSDWYANIGPYLTVTFILQAIGPIATNLYNYFISAPCKRCYAFPKIANLSSHKYVRQADVNALELGKIFDVTSNTAQLQALLFFAMTYSPGIPLLMPLCAFVFLIYFNVDKLLLLRYYHKPPKMGDAVMRVVLDFLPWAAVIRLAIACWMLSSHQLFPDSKLLINKIPDFPYFNAAHISHIYNQWIREQAGDTIYSFNTGHRILRGHVFPLFVLLLIIFLPLLIMKFWRYSPFYFLQRTVSLLISNIRKLNPRKSSPTVKPFDLVVSGDELRSEMAPFTGDYFQFLRSELSKQGSLKCLYKLIRRLRNDLSPEELEEGWRVSYQGANKVRMIQWTESVTIGGVTRPKGSLKRTYEIISAHGCISYALAKIPHYVKVMGAIQEGVTSILDDNDEEMGAVSIVGAYRKHHQKKQEGIAKEIKQKEELWTKKKPKNSKVVPTEELQQNGKNIPRGYDKVRVFSGEDKPEVDDDDDDDDLDD